MARVIKQLILLVATSLVGATLVASPSGAAPTWQPVTNLFADLSAVGGSAQTPTVEVDSAGTATALWSRWDGGQWVVQASTRPAGGTWGAPVDIAAGGGIRNPQLAVDPSGTATAVWRSSDGVTSVVQAATRPAGGSWSTPIGLSVDATVNPSDLPDVPQVAVDAAGTVTATWSHRKVNNSVVQAATRLGDGTWTAPVDLSESGQSPRSTDIAVDPAGNATAIWVSGNLVQSATRPAGQAWNGPVVLSYVAGPRANPRLVVDPAGTVTAVWGSFTVTYGIQTATRPLGGTWAAPTDLSTAGGDTFDTPQLAVDPQGNVTAVWQRQNSGWVVAAATRVAGGTWGPAVDLSAPGQDAWDPQVAVDPSGNATAVWSLAEDAGRTVQAARRPAGGAWTEAVDLSEKGDAWNPQVAIDPAGNATATWSRLDGTWIVQARGLDAAGPVVTGLSAQAAGNTRGTQAYKVRAYDVWSTVASASWRFADGTTATGTSVTHAAGGSSAGPVRVTLTDRVGNATVCVYTDTYACRSTTRAAPVITRGSLTRHTIRAHGSRSAAPRKTRVRLDVTADARATLVLRKMGTRKTVQVTERLEAGRNVVTIRARLSRRTTLLPGRYVLIVTAKNKVGTSAKEKFRLRVVR